MIRRHFFLAGALLMLALMIVFGGMKLAAKSAAETDGGRRSAGGPHRSGATVSVVAVQARSFSDPIEVLGVAKGRQSVTLTAAATQLVDKVRFTDGQAVQRGAVLVELRDTEQDAGLAQSQAKLVEARRAYDRYRTLAAKGFASKAAVDQYEAAYLSAQADVAAARARRNDRMIRAPFSGVVGISDVAPGALVNPGAPIVTLDDLSAIRVDFQVPERYLAQLTRGQPIVATTEAYPGETIRGRIASLDTRVDERTRAITARAEFPNPARRLKPGMMMRVGISRGEREVPALPEAAVSVEADSAFVFLIRRKGAGVIAERRAVAAGARQGGFVEILDGVSIGDRVVADGLHKVQPGQAVRVAAGGAPPAGARTSP